MNQRGLTLVEVLVALGIFAAVSAIGVGAMGLAANGSRQLEAASERVGEIERMRSVLRSDLYQLTGRKVREPDQEGPRPAFVGGDALDDLLPEEDDEDLLLALVRGGWDNPGAREPRAEVQAVTYLAREDKLIRRTRPFLDAVRDTPYRDDVLLDGLAEIEIAFLSRGDWREEAGRGDQKPVAVRLSFVHPVYGPMRHVFLVEDGR